MNKKLIAVAIAASLAAPMAMAEVTVYGKVRQAIDFVDVDDGIGSEIDNIQINDKSSRIGFKGSEDLGNGLKAVFKMEFGVGISSSHGNNYESGTTNYAPGIPYPDGDAERNEFSPADGKLWAGRNAYVGLAGDFGTVLIGRHDHPLKMSTGKFDIFADTIADNGNRWQYQYLADLRADGTVAYVSPNFSGLTLLAALVPGENNSADGISDAYSVAAMYSNGGIDVSLAYETGDGDLDNSLASTLDDYEQTRFGAGYTGDNFGVNLVYTDIDDAYDSWKVAGYYAMGNNKIKAQYWSADFEFAGVDGDGWTVGLEHNFSKRTQAQVVYNTTDVDSDVYGADLFSIQMNHNF